MDAPKLEELKTETAQQMQRYLQTERLAKPDVWGFFVVFLGGEIAAWGAAEPPTKNN